MFFYFCIFVFYDFLYFLFELGQSPNMYWTVCTFLKGPSDQFWTNFCIEPIKIWTFLFKKIKGNRTKLGVYSLQEDIHRDVLALSPQNLVKAAALAKLFEEKYNHTTKPKCIGYQPKHNTPF